MCVPVRIGAGDKNVFELKLRDVLILDTDSMLGILIGRRVLEQLGATVNYSTGQCVLGSVDNPTAQWQWKVDEQTDLYYLPIATGSSQPSMPRTQYGVPVSNRYGALQQAPNGRA
jgi:hypothetical protein